MEYSLFIIIGVLRVVLCLCMLIYAAYKDIKSREVSDLLWIIFSVPAVLFDAYDVYVGKLPAIDLLISVGFAIVFGLLVGYMGFFGGADLIAFIVVALYNPVVPLPGFEVLGFRPLLYPLSFISNSILLGALASVLVLATNLTSGSRLFDGYYNVPLWKKLMIMVSARKMNMADVRGPPFHYPLEKFEDGSTKRSLVVRPDIDDDEAAITIINRLKANGVDSIWVSHTLPFLLIMALGYVVTVLVGDFMLGVLSKFI